MNWTWTWIRNNLKIAAALVGLGVLAFLAFGAFGVHTKFIDDKVSEDGPVFASSAVGTEPVIAAEEITPVEAEPVDEPATVPGEIVTLVRGTFGERSHPGGGTAVVLNDGSEERFLRFEDDFATDNGPDLFVYLTTADADAPASDFGVNGQFVDLGRLSGNVGSQNYEIPVGLDLGEFDTVVIWCDRFSVAFTTADLA